MQNDCFLQTSAVDFYGKERKIMIKELVKKNRSYRTFKREFEISRGELLDFIDTARLTPSAVNAQPLLYAPLDKEKTDRILPYTRWAKALDIELPPIGRGPSAFILVCIDKNKTPSASPAMRDVGIAAQTILLAAAEKGLGGCMIGSFDNGGIKRELGFPDNIDVLLCIALGKPDETVILEDMDKNGSTAYYRDENNRHHVPKRRLEDIII